MKRRFILATFLLSTLFLSGCSMLDSPEELTGPPKLKGDKEEIRLALKDYLPPNARPLIPPTEELGSHIQLIDLDGDGEDEAVVFYNIDLEENPIRILVLKKENSVWKNKPEIKITGQELDRVLFKDLDGDGGMEIVIGSKIKYSINKEINIYSISTGNLENIFKAKYDEIVIDDLNNDKDAELLLLELNRDTNKSIGELYKYYTGKMRKVDTISFNDGAEMNYAAYDYIYRNQKGIVISTTTGEDLVNIYMLTVKDLQLESLLTDGVIQSKKPEGSQVLVPRDMNNDGTIEVAIPSKFQEDEAGESDLVNWVTEWRTFDGKGSTRVEAINYYDEKLNFTFELPLRWRDRLTITNLTKNENTIKQVEYVRVEYRGNEDTYKTHLFTISIYDKDKLKRSEGNPISKDSKLILEDDTRVYYIDKNKDINENKNSFIDQEIKEIEKTFRLLEDKI